MILASEKHSEARAARVSAVGSTFSRLQSRWDQIDADIFVRNIERERGRGSTWVLDPSLKRVKPNFTGLTPPIGSK